MYGTRTRVDGAIKSDDLPCKSHVHTNERARARCGERETVNESDGRRRKVNNNNGKYEIKIEREFLWSGKTTGKTFKSRVLNSAVFFCCIFLRRAFRELFSEILVNKNGETS